MVIVKIIGGLGNQMFQYACGRALAEFYHVHLQLDLRGFKKYKLHQYLLDKFSITAKTANESELIKIVHPEHQFLKKLFGQQRNEYRVIREKSLAYDPALTAHGPNIYLDGYWQSEKYFINIRDIILKEFQLRQPLDLENYQYLNSMTSSQSVSLHVRRTDYINNPLYEKCTLNYYQQALATIAKRSPNLHLFVFSDDPDWVKNNIKTSFPTTFITNNIGKANYLDLVLMSKCHHHIIANSTFSWWGAWLGSRTDGVVIAPNVWYTDPTKNTKDLLPTDWITVQI